MVNKVSPKGPDSWGGSNGKIWRHTIGRVSSATQVVINTIAVVGQGVKIVGKVAALPVTYSIVGVKSLITKNKTSYNGSWSLKGIALDGIGFLGLGKKVGVCFKNTIVAPSRESAGFVKGIKGTVTILSGKLQNLKNEPLSVSYRVLILGQKRFPPNKSNQP